MLWNQNNMKHVEAVLRLLQLKDLLEIKTVVIQNGSLQYHEVHEVHVQ